MPTPDELKAAVAGNEALPMIRLTDRRFLNGGDADVGRQLLVYELRYAQRHMISPSFAVFNTVVPLPATGELFYVEITGTVDSTPMRDRQRGFMDVIHTDPRFTVVESICGDFLRSKGAECAIALFEEFGPDGIDVIYSHNDAMTLGALDIMEQRGMRPGEEILVITVDGEKEAVDALKEGKINCVVQCTPDLGPAAMSLAKDLTAGSEVPKTTHPEEGVFSDFDDLSDPAVEGF